MPKLSNLFVTLLVNANTFIPCMSKSETYKCQSEDTVLPSHNKALGLCFSMPQLTLLLQMIPNLTLISFIFIYWGRLLCVCWFVCIYLMI